MKSLLGIVSALIFLQACQKNSNQGLTIANSSQQNILGGFQVLPSDPLSKHVVMLRIYSVKDVNEERPERFKLCTGIIISKIHILSAAHCFDENQEGKIQIAEVHFTTDSKEDDSLHKVNYALKIRSHEEYQVKQQSHFDMAVAKINQEIPEGYEPVSILPAAVELAAGDTVISLGYGLKNDAPKLDATGLNKVTGVPVKEDQGTRIILDQSAGKGICSGDSGGPTFYNYQGKNYLVGINESVMGVAPQEKPTCRSQGVIVKAQTFKPWILKAIKEL